MNQESNLYCRFENFCCHFLQEKTNTVKEKSWNAPIEDVYVEYFSDIHSLKMRVLQLYNTWMNKHKFHNRQEEAYYPGFMIFNQWHDWTIIGFCPQGWHLFNSGFSTYIRLYVISLNFDQYSKHIRKIQGRGFDFDISVDHMDYEMNLLSEELMDLELKCFLERIEITEKIKQEVYYPEMVRRGYIDILNET